MKTFVTFLFVFYSASVLSYEGRILVLKGSGTVISKGKTVNAKVGHQVMGGDSVITGANSVLILVMTDKAVMKLNENTELIIPAEREDGIVLNLGSVFAKVPKQDSGGTFKVRTKSMVAGVRGTQFFTSYGPGSRTKDGAWLCVNEGSVEVTSFKGNKSVLVTQGEGILVPAGGEVTAPKKYAWTKGLNWNLDESSGDIFNKTKIDYKDLMLKEQYD